MKVHKGSDLNIYPQIEISYQLIFYFDEGGKHYLNP